MLGFEPGGDVGSDKDVVQPLVRVNHGVHQLELSANSAQVHRRLIERYTPFVENGLIVEKHVLGQVALHVLQSEGLIEYELISLLWN